MKISVIIPSFFPATVYGGPIISSLNTCRELSKLQNIEVYVSTTNANMTSKLEVKTNEWNEFSPSFYVKYFNETIVGKFSIQLLFNIWKDIAQAEVVHIQGIFNSPIPISLFYAKILNKKTILSPRGALGEWCLKSGNNLKKIWLKFLIKPFAKKIIWHSTSLQEKDEIKSIFPLAKVFVIPNGVDYESYQRASHLPRNEFVKRFAKKELDAEKIIVSIGRLQRKKGFNILIDAFARSLKMHSNAKLFIAGPDEGEEKNLENQINILGLKNKVFLIGFLDGQDKIDFLASADLFVLPSFNENFGNVYIESLAAGTPIIATTKTPWSDVEENKCGRCVENTVDDISDAIEDVLKKDKHQMQLNSKKYSRNFDWKHIALKFKNFYQNI